MNFAYAYDSRGNITSETRNGKATTYTYDALGQLIRVNDPHDTTAGASGTTWVYNYDRGGNITSKSYYAYTTGTPGTAVDTITYSYTDSNWKDKLTAYDGQTITYDAIGNPLNDGTWTYTWEKGRQLKQMSKSGMTVEFKYDHNGLRTQKKVTSGGEVTTTEYTLHGKLVTHLTRGSDEMHFFYDAQSRPAMVDFNGALYSYVHNLQGDVVGIVDSAGSLVVEYKYDAWGKPTLVRTLTTAYEALAELNPFRYRGYVFDEETGLYYLRSRYYNSECLKFANCDEIYADQSDELFDHNKFAYVNSCPTNRKDEDGFFWHIAIGAIVGGLVGAVGSVISQVVEHGLDFSKIDTGEVVAAGVAGAASGALAATGVGVVGQVVVNAMISGAENVANQTILADEDEEFDPLDLAIDMAIGGLGGAIGGRGASFAKKGTKVVSMTNHITSLTRRTNRRIIQGLNSRNISVARKAITYYRKNTRVLYRNLRKGLARGFLVSTVYRVGKPLYEHIS